MTFPNYSAKWPNSGVVQISDQSSNVFIDCLLIVFFILFQVCKHIMFNK